MSLAHGQVMASRPQRDMSFQRMLELEKQYKLQRLQTSQANGSERNTPSPTSPNSRPPLQSRRADSLQSGPLSMNTTRRSAPTSPLSITIPTHNGKRKIEATRLESTRPAARQEDVEEHSDSGSEYDDEAEDQQMAGQESAKTPLANPKSQGVRFEDSDDESEDDDASEVSSICQSPSWEGYGLKKKKKQEQAEKRRREKEQAEREAKAAKKRLAARLSKAPPSDKSRRPTSSLSLTRRSNSAPLLDQHRFLPSTQASSETLPSSHTTIVAQPANGPVSDEIKQRAMRMAMETVAYSPYAFSVGGGFIAGLQRPKTTRTPSATSIVSTTASTARNSSSSRDAARNSAETCPPSASRTYTLQQSSASPATSRRSVLLTSAGKLWKTKEMKSNKGGSYSSSVNSQESDQTAESASNKSIDNERGRPSQGYVRHQREQSRDRALSGFMDEQLVTQANEPHARRSASALAMRTTSSELTSSANQNIDADQFTDYFTFDSRPYSPPVLDLISPLGNKRPSSVKDNPRIQTTVPTDILSDLSSSTSNGPPFAQQPTPRNPARLGNRSQNVTSKGLFSLQLSSQPRRSSLNKALRVLGATQQVSAEEPRPQPITKRASDGSSSSSTFDEVSLTPSPATTPSNSRPQSQKGRRSASSEASSVAKTDSTTSEYERTMEQHRSSESEGVPSAAPSLESTGGSEAEDSWSKSTPVIDPGVQLAISPSASLDDPTPKASHYAQSQTYRSSEMEPLQEEGAPLTSTELPRRSGSLRRYLSTPNISETQAPSTSFLPELKHQPLAKRASQGAERNRDLEAVSGKYRASSALGETSSASAYLQEARKSVPVPPTSPLRLNPPNSSRLSMTPGIKGAMPPMGTSVHSPTVVAPLVEQSRPVAKMFVECCGCKFYHDLPSKIYECMAQPDTVVEDRSLGISGAITTMVKCPWCAHNMSTVCCSGYAAVVYLKEKLH